MLDIYNYRKNITITTTPNGDKVITMNDAILTALINHIDDASEFQRSKGYGATADDTKELWRALNEKHNKED
jgi:hypothetical protein